MKIKLISLVILWLTMSGCGGEDGTSHSPSLQAPIEIHINPEETPDVFDLIRFQS